MNLYLYIKAQNTNPITSDDKNDALTNALIRILFKCTIWQKIITNTINTGE